MTNFKFGVSRYKTFRNIFALGMLTLLVLSLSSMNAFATTTDIDSPVDGATLTTKPTTFSGSTVTGGLIHLKEDGVTIASTNADNNGVWTITTSNVKNGSHSYTAVADFGTVDIGFLTSDTHSQIDVVSADNQGQIYQIDMTPGYVSQDLVVRGTTLYVAVFDPAQECRVLEYDTRNFELIRQFEVATTCSSPLIDVNADGTRAALVYYNSDFTSDHVVIADLDTGTVIDDEATPYSQMSGPRFSNDGSKIYVRPVGSLIEYSLQSNNLVVTQSQTYNSDYSENIAVSPIDGSIIISESDAGSIRVVNPNDFDDNETYAVVEGSGIARIAISHDGTKLLVVGYDGEYYISEFSLETFQTTHRYAIPDYPEAVGYYPDDSQYIVGDNNHSGSVYFGTSGSDTYDATFANAGRRYAMRNSDFITSIPSTDTSDVVTTTNSFPADGVKSTYGSNPDGTTISKTVSPGSQVDVSGSGFLPNSDVTITLYSTPVVLKTLKANASGTFSTTVTIPSDTSLGSHTLVSSGTDANGNAASSTLTLTVAKLAATGNNSHDQAYLALLLIGAGFVLFKFGRDKPKLLRILTLKAQN